MARGPAFLNRFNGGELSDLVEGRMDLDWFNAGCRIMENMVGLPQGPATRRPGTRFVAELDNSAAPAQLVNFEFNTEQAYIIELGEFYARFLKDEGLISVADTSAAVSNGSFTANIAGWSDLSTGAATISHDAANGRLSLNGAAAAVAWAEQSIATAQTDVEHVVVFRVLGAAGNHVHVQIGTASGGAEILSARRCETGWHAVAFTPTASPFFLQLRNAELAKTVQIDDVALLDNAPLKLAGPYTEDQLAAVRWGQSIDVLYLTHPEVPQYKLARSGHTTWALTELAEEDGPYLEENGTPTTLAPSAATGFAITLTASGVTGINDDRGWLASDVGRMVRIGHPATSWAASTAYAVNDIRYNQGAVFKCTSAGTSAGSGGPTGTGSNIVDGGALWEFQNTGGLRWGWARIVGWTSATVVTADVGGTFGATSAVAAWRLGLWSHTTGFPADVTFHEERLFFCGAAIVRPMRFDGSVSGDFQNSAPGSRASDPIAYNIGASDVNPLRWIISHNELFVGTASGEARVKGDSDNAPLTAAGTNAKFRSRIGSADAKPLLVGNSILFIQRQGRKLYEFTQSDFDMYEAQDITVRAEHITKSGLLQIVYQKEPWSIVWGRLGDGGLVGLTFQRKEGVLGWHRHPLGGNFAGGAPVVESLATIPAPARRADQLWLIVKRTINGVTKRYIEFMEAGHAKGDAQADAFYVDCGLTYDSTPATGISGLGHLEGESVRILADGAARPNETVTAGAITLDRVASKAQIGLGTAWKIQPQRITVPAEEGPGQAKKRRIERLAMRWLRTLGVEVGRDEDHLEALEFGIGPMSAAPPLFSGLKDIPFRGHFDREGDVLFVGDSAFPATLVSITPLTEAVD